jgi:cytochrome c553
VIDAIACERARDPRGSSLKSRGRATAVALCTATALTLPVGAVDAPPPAWAYPVNPPGLPAPPDDPAPRHVPDSTAEFTLAQIRDLFGVPDWHPDDHPPMPEIVARGRKPGVFACGYCHLPNGLGRPENSSLAGLPADYIVRQVAEFKSGARRSAEPRSVPINFMIAVAKAATDEEVRSAAEYFAALKPAPWIRVIESASVPRTRVAGWMLVAVEPIVLEPIGQRIVEMPVDLERTELRDARSGFVAYVPPGSLAQGERLVNLGGPGKTIACGICHGEDLRGLGPVPALAGRSPSYIVRQLYDLQQGVRKGQWAALMQEVVARLSLEDMVAIAAYTASRTP